MYISEVLSVDGAMSLVRCRVEPWWPMRVADGVHPLILVELAAQAAGVCNGWDRIRTLGPDSSQMGWLVGVKRAEFFIEFLQIGRDVLVEARNSTRFGNLREVICAASIDGRQIATSTLQLYQA